MSQPNPTPGKDPVPEFARNWFNTLFSDRLEQGQRTYGTQLHTFNGRSAVKDLAEELVDAWLYLSQIALEHRDLAQYVDDLKAENEELRRRLGEDSCSEE